MEKKYYASIQFKKHSAAMRFLVVKLVFSARSPPFQKTFGRDAFYYCKTAYFCKIAPHFKKHSAAMHFTIVKLPFSARSPPAQILCVDKIGFSAEKLLQDLGYRIEVQDRGIGSRYRIEV